MSNGESSAQALNRTLRNTGLLVLRLGAGGLLILLHGYPHLIWFIDGHKFADPLGLGSRLSLGLVTTAEFGCAILVLAGWLTRLACIPILFTLAVAAFVHHAGSSIEAKETALLYMVPFIALTLLGPGQWSVDRK